MAIGPVQLLVLGFDKPDFKGEVIAEFAKLKEHDVVRVIDALVVVKDANGEVAAVELSDLSDEERAEFGAMVGALVGLGAAGEEGAEAGAVAGAELMTEEGVFSEQDAWDVLEEIPNDSAAAIILLEHRWAIPLRDAIRNANGFHVSDGWVHPLDLVAIGVIASEEAAALSTDAQST
jgi:uncharacterized membrane protein